jgi:hypothetical protein
MPLGQILAGNLIIAADVQDELDELESWAKAIVATKSATTGPRVNNTKSNDPHLAITLIANRTYEIFGSMLITGGNNAGDFAYGWNWTNTATVTVNGVGAHNSLLSGTQAPDLEIIAYPADAATPTASTPYAASTGNSGAYISALVVVGNADILLTLEWAEATTNATGTSLLAGSRIAARRIA